jgi:hypothetical protein
MIHDSTKKEVKDTQAQHEGGQPEGRGYTEEPPQVRA